jgi:hypothetical protein
VSIRQFTDRRGTTWRVWATYPVHAATIAKRFREGWLTFQNGAVRRRLAPVPESWQDVSDDRLELYCSAADAVRERESRADLAVEQLPEIPE